MKSGKLYKIHVFYLFNFSRNLSNPNCSANAQGLQYKRLFLSNGKRFIQTFRQQREIISNPATIHKVSFNDLSVFAFTPLYDTLVRPNLENAMQACLPNLVAYADCLEQIYRFATRLVKGFRRLPYEERLRRLSLHFLKRRRLRGDLIAAWKIKSGPQPQFYSARAPRLERSSFQSFAGS